MKYIKKISITIITLVMTIMLTGCIRLDIGVMIHEDGTTDLSFLYAAMDMSANENSPMSLSEGMSEDAIISFREKGWDIEDYKQDGYTGTIISVKNVPSEELDKKLNELFSIFKENDKELDTPSEKDSSEEDSIFEITEEKGVYKVTIDFKDSISNAGADSTMGAGMSAGSMAQMIKGSGGFFTFTVTLPEEAYIDSNADTISEDGNTLTWDLLEIRNDKEDLWFSFKRPGKAGTILNIIKTAGIILLGVFIILLLIFFIIRPIFFKHKEGNNNHEKTMENAVECKWCNGIEKTGIRIQYCGIGSNGKIVSFNRKTNKIIYGTALYCPNCGRKIGEPRKS